MTASFTHADVMRRWDKITTFKQVTRSERDQFQFQHVSSEFHIDLFSAEIDSEPDLLGFWISAIKPDFLEETDPRWEREYRQNGTARPLTTQEFAAWFARWQDALLPEYRFAPPANLIES